MANGSLSARYARCLHGRSCTLGYRVVPRVPVKSVITEKTEALYL
jgi:hypothetical protein